MPAAFVVFELGVEVLPGAESAEEAAGLGGTLRVAWLLVPGGVHDDGGGTPRRETGGDLGIPVRLLGRDGLGFGRDGLCRRLDDGRLDDVRDVAGDLDLGDGLGLGRLIDLGGCLDRRRPR